MINRYFLTITIILATLMVEGQDQTTIVVNYLPAISLGKTADFTNNFSPRGMDFEVNKYLKEDLSLGIVFSWNIFREKIVGESFEYKDLLITGTQFRYTNLAPININMKRFFFANNNKMLYAGFGIGTTYAKQSNELGVFEFSNDKWLFNIAPEIGMHYNTSYKSFLSFKLKYNYGFKASDFPSMSYLSFGMGLGIK